MRARQQQGQIRFAVINRVHVTVGFLSLIGLAALIWIPIGARDWEKAAWPVFLLLALLGNAFICGALSNPHDRYQSRMMWLPTFALAFAVPGKLAFSLRKPIESGT
jgi:hypothetical protein